MIKFTNDRGGSGNYPFNNYQKFYLNLFSNVLSPSNPEFNKDVNDACYFNTSLMVDDTMKQSVKVRKFLDENNVGSAYKVGRSYSIEGFLQEVRASEDTIRDKKRKVITISLFAPSEEYRNPFQDLDTSNPNNGKEVGHLYEIKSAYTTLGKKLLNKLSSLPKNAHDKKVKITIFQKFDESGKKFKKDGTPDYDVSVKVDGESLKPRFVNPKQIENPSEELLQRLKSDSLNDNFIEICEENTGEDFRIETDKFFRKHLENELQHFVFENYFVPKMKDMGFEVKIEGEKYKYNKIGGVEVPQVDSEPDDYDDEPVSKPKTTKKGIVVKSDEEYENDLPF